MSLYKRYRMKKSAEFTRLVGVSYGTFQIILEKLNRQLVCYKAEKKLRQRERKSSFSIENQLLLTLIYLRQYHTFFAVRRDVFNLGELRAKTS